MSNRPTLLQSAVAAKSKAVIIPTPTFKKCRKAFRDEVLVALKALGNADKAIGLSVSGYEAALAPALPLLQRGYRHGSNEERVMRRLWEVRKLVQLHASETTFFIN